MNQEDKKRFARYRKGFIPSKEDDELLLLHIKNNQISKESKKTQSLGYINNIDVNSENLIKNITNKTK